ncbi:MAG: hypothetical protein LBQ41_02760 [Candidatus Ancillula sp.]|jgi:lipopolysaccharide biosynthesis glycosyltransferase|nr:hypothetical protein [Candidatus Ancillula sp.]
MSNELGNAESASINLGYVCSELYAKYLAVQLVSVLENNSDVEFQVFVLIDKMSDESQNRINNILAHYSQKSAQFIPIDPEVIKSLGLPQFQSSFIPYYRFLFEGCLPKNVEKLLYLDVDSICLNSLKPLWNISHEGNSLISIRPKFLDEMCGQELEEYLKMYRITKKEQGFQSSTLLLDFKTMRGKGKTTSDMLEYMRGYQFDNHGGISDNEILIEYFLNDTKTLDYNWGAIIDKEFLLFDLDEKNLPPLLNLYGMLKPWTTLRSLPGVKQYYSYYDTAKRILGAQEVGFTPWTRLDYWRTHRKWLAILPSRLYEWAYTSGRAAG